MTFNAFGYLGDLESTNETAITHDIREIAFDASPSCWFVRMPHGEVRRISKAALMRSRGFRSRNASVELGNEGEVIIENGEIDPATFVDNGDGTQGPGGVEHEFAPPAPLEAVFEKFGIQADERGRMLLLGGAAFAAFLAFMAFRRK